MTHLQLIENSRIGLFGGTFDPPHWGHIKAAMGAADELNLDQLAFLPANNPPHKRDRKFTPIHKRKHMLELCSGLDQRFRLCMIEAEDDLPGTTLHTVERLREIGYNEEFCHLIWLMGSDSLHDLPTWHSPERLLESIEIAIMPRPGYPVDKAQTQFLKEVRILKTPLVKISAEEIRSKQVRLGEAVPAPVAEYIIKNCLYGFAPD
ncbi:nicotinate (nicotinamide) nucleotide adenylyltransferase [candidate division LCP-89 bacterium B3_LCP]|uniref:Probable nicotinate-nucleotide adenylyltransferase n=1 Tax=candidate division LCP-89 bacterium B3_LCP TaxID=2012998 RepID=A0A532V0I9_UNCL8|nr:MAG: nicotinate (nicotinamide) nucleotide adenylyltransferase [candidate division LCP-89 bacterium B3_LCP]